MFFRALLSISALLIGVAACPSPSNEVVIVTLGDSLTEGVRYGVPVNHTYPYYLHQNLEESEARAKDFAEVASDWFWETDQDLRITYMTEKYATSSDTPINQMIGKTRREILMQSGEPISEEWTCILQKLENHEDYSDFVYSNLSNLFFKSSISIC